MEQLRTRSSARAPVQAAMFRVECGRQGGQVCGTISNSWFSGYEPFRGLDELLLKIDRMCDLVRVPERDAMPRSLETRGSTLPRLSVARRKPAGEGEINPYELLRRSGEGAAEPGAGAIFTIHVKFRQHASMQGLVVLSNHRRVLGSAAFRSGMELMRMLNAAVPGEKS